MEIASQLIGPTVAGMDSAFYFAGNAGVASSVEALNHSEVINVGGGNY